MQPEESTPHEYSREQIGNFHEEMLGSLPDKIKQNYQVLQERSKPFNSFQLIANISHYNHQHDANEYSDYRDGRMFIISEIVAIHCLKSSFKETCEVPALEFYEAVQEIQESTSSYFGLRSALEMDQLYNQNASTLEQITHKLHRDEVVVRNPGHPDYHLIFNSELYEPLKQELTNYFGFSLDESIIIRQQVFKMINERFQVQIKNVKLQASKLVEQVENYKRNGKYPEESPLIQEQFKELKNTPAKRLYKLFLGHYTNEILFNLQNVYAFTAEELAVYCKLSVDSVKKFLKQLSVRFGEVDPNQDLIIANSILKSKPIINHGEYYIIPSFSLLTWSVEPLYENFIKTSPKLSAKFKDNKHDFLLTKGMEYFSRLFSHGTLHPQNLFYEKDGNVCETDGLIAYDTILFVIEAKGNRITSKAKEGNFQRTESHLKDLIKDATLQGKRTVDFIRGSGEAVFFTKGKKEIIIIDSKKYDEIFIVSLTLEPVGHLTPLIKVANDLNFFPEHVFPWIISLYDLVVIADHIELDILFLHYLRRRQRFLQFEYFQIYEEIDMLAYYLNNGLYIEHMLNEIQENSITGMSFDNNTDAINDYYNYMFGHKKKFTPKVKSHLPEDFIKLLIAIENSSISHRTKIMLEMLSANTESIKKLMAYIKKVRNQYRKDRKLHDCSICFGSGDNQTGITYMIGKDHQKLDFMLYHFCLNKFNSLKPVAWVGIGDVDPDNNYNIRCSFIAMAQFEEQ